LDTERAVSGLLATNDVWETAAEAEFRWHVIADGQVERYAQLLSRLKRELGDLSGSEEWAEALRFLRFGLFAISGAPLPMDHEALGLSSLERDLRRSLPVLEASAPQYSTAILALVDELAAMAASPRDPLGDRVRELLGDRSGDVTCLVLRRARRVEAVEDVFSHLGRVKVASGNQLREAELFGRVIAIGPSTWFPTLLSAPRAKDIEIVHLRVTRDEPSSPSLFEGSKSRGGMLQRRPRSAAAGPEASVVGVDDDLFRPRVEWAAIDRAGRRSHVADDEPFDDVRARLLLLADGYACYLEAEPGSRSTILDLRAATPEDRVRQVEWGDVERGVVLILRTEGGDDVSHLADLAMGGRASALREKQQAWKSQLRKEVLLRGYAHVTEMLRRLGSPLASPQNVQNWSSMRTIKTRDLPDFEAIMKLIGKDDQAKETWEAMREIHKAHSRAGFDRVARLRERIQQADLSALVSTGRVDFEVPSLGAGTLTAFRVEDVSSETFMVSPYQVDRPFRVSEALWHG
jgi:hypothetical protein